MVIERVLPIHFVCKIIMSRSNIVLLKTNNTFITVHKLYQIRLRMPTYLYCNCTCFIPSSDGASLGLIKGSMHYRL